MNEIMMRRLLRLAAWTSIGGALLGLGIEGAALYKALTAADAAGRARFADSAFTAAVFWIVIWIELPFGAFAFWRYLTRTERALGLGLPLLALAGAGAALALR
jgi:hypothetical protein